jgi:type I restriction enzyme M protein
MAKNETPQLLRAIRDKLNLSQEQLAGKLNVSFATVNRWEAGTAKPQKAKAEAIETLVEEAGLSAGEEANQRTEMAGRRRRGVQKSSVLGNKSMEQMLWDAACSIRGEKDAPKFKDYLLPLLFVKRLSDVFDDEIARLADQFGDRDTALEVLEADHSLVRFYIPAEARWGILSGRTAFEWSKGKEPKTLGEQLTTTIRAIVKHNPSLAGVIDIVDFNETRNGEREISDAALKGVIETYSDPRYRLGLHDVEPDFLGRCYEYLLRKFAEGQGQSAGEFFSPTEVGFLIAELMRPRPGEECYDYACGSFGLLIKLQIVSRRLDPLSRVPLKLYGQEFTGSSYAIACMNKIIHDMEGEVVRGDSMRNPKFKDAENRLKKFDVVVANPMWNQPFDPDVYEKDSFERFEEHGGITTSKGDWAWLQHTLATLKDTGRAAVVLDTGAVTRGSGSKNDDKERNIRKWFVDHDLIDGVVLLPANLFYNMTGPGVIVLLRKGKPANRRGRIVLIDASRECKKGTPKNYLTEEGITRVAKAYASGEPVESLSTIITTEDAKEADYNLLPSTHIGLASSTQYHDLGDLRKSLENFAATESRLLNVIDAVLTKASGGALGTLLASRLPEDWSWSSLSDVYRITKKSRELSIQPTDEIPFVPMDSVPTNGKDVVRFQHKQRKDVASGTYFERGDVLLAKITPSFENGKQGMGMIPSEYGFASTELIPLQAIEDGNNYFLFYYLLHPEIRTLLEGKMEGSTGRQRVPESAVRALQLPSPPGDEPAKIAAVLNLVQQCVEIQEQKREALQQVFKTLLHKLLTGELRLSDLSIDTSEVTKK